MAYNVGRAMAEDVESLSSVRRAGSASTGSIDHIRIGPHVGTSAPDALRRNVFGDKVQIRPLIGLKFAVSSTPSVTSQDPRYQPPRLLSVFL